MQFKKSREADDKLLPQSDLQALKLAFFQRYHIKFPPKLTPSDRLVSKLARQQLRRSLDAQDLSKVRSLAYQRPHQSKKQRLVYSGGIASGSCGDGRPASGHGRQLSGPALCLPHGAGPCGFATSPWSPQRL